MSFMMPSAPALPVTPASPAAPPGLAPATMKPQRKGQQPTFLGAQLSPTGEQAPQRTLMGGAAGTLG